MYAALVSVCAPDCPSCCNFTGKLACSAVPCVLCCKLTINIRAPAPTAERRHVVGSRAPGPRAFSPLRIAFMSLNVVWHRVQWRTAAAVCCYSVLQGHFVLFNEIPRRCVNSTAEGKFAARLEILQPAENCGP
jgi:hypothetical protein